MKKKDMNTAQKILSQLGGNQFILMTDSKCFVDCGNGLSMKLDRNISNANSLKITLTASDTYDMRFSKITNKGEERLITEYKGVCTDRLTDHFTAHTGLYTAFADF